MRQLILSAITFTLAASAHAQMPTADAVLNSFLSEYASSNIAWQGDIRTRQLGQPLSPGRQIGKSTYFGDYSYRPYTYAELSKQQQLQVMADPRLPDYIKWFAAQRIPESHLGKNPPEKLLAQSHTSQLQNADGTNNLIPPVDLRPDIGRYNYTVSVNQLLSPDPIYLRLSELGTVVQAPAFQPDAK